MFSVQKERLWLITCKLPVNTYNQNVNRPTSLFDYNAPVAKLHAVAIKDLHT